MTFVNQAHADEHARWQCHDHHSENCLCSTSSERLFLLRTAHAHHSGNPYLKEYVVELTEGQASIATKQHIAELISDENDTSSYLEGMSRAEAAGLATWNTTEGEWIWHA